MHDRKRVLQVWQGRRCLDATYGQLLYAFLKAEEARAAKELCNIVASISEDKFDGEN